MKYEAEGNFKMGRERCRFTKTVEAEDEERARDKVRALLGSEHRVKRNEIYIERLEPL